MVTGLPTSSQQTHIALNKHAFACDNNLLD